METKNLLMQKREAERLLSQSILVFRRIAEREVSHNGFWQLSKSGLIKIQGQLNEIVECYESLDAINRRIETKSAVKTLGGFANGIE